jgi:hypothetical protein
MSTAFKLDNVDGKKLLKGLAVAVGGAGLTYLTEWISGTDFGTATPMIVAGFGFLANFIRKFFTNTEGVV